MKKQRSVISVISGGEEGAIESFGFPRRYRLLTPAEYGEVFDARMVLRGGLFVLHFRVGTGLDSKLGLVIPKKMARLAVVRNAVKRQARELFRSRRADLPRVDIVLRLAQPVGPVARMVGGVDSRIKALWRAEITALLDRLCRKLSA